MLLADDRWLNNPVVENQLLDAVLETLYMTAATGFFTALFGLPLGVLLHNLAPRGCVRSARCTARSA